LRAAALLACLAALLGAACSSDRSHLTSDWERENAARLAKEGEEALPAQQLPAFPRQENLIRFFVSSASDFTFFVDRASISVKDKIVRYTLVARSASGADNVTYEGISCVAGEYRVYAFGRADGSWQSRPGLWREISPRSVQRWHNALQREFFCPNKIAVADAAEAVRALELGGHPVIKVMPSYGGGAR
jgi:hypothetical protein